MPSKSFRYLVMIFIAASCRTSNKKVFEEYTDIKIPTAVKVTNDEYQDMGQDYVKILELHLDKKSKEDLTSSIIKSKFFNPSVFSGSSLIYENQELKIDHIKGLWFRNKNGYCFSGSKIDLRDNIFVTVDTLTMTARFSYSAD